MAYERFGKEHLALTKVIEKYFGADARYLDISCLDVARAVLEAGWTKPVKCENCEYGVVDDEAFPNQYLCKHNGSDWNEGEHFCSYGVE